MKSFINGGKGGVSQIGSNGNFGGGGAAATCIHRGRRGSFSGGGVEAKEHEGAVGVGVHFIVLLDKKIVKKQGEDMAK